MTSIAYFTSIIWSEYFDLMNVTDLCMCERETINQISNNNECK